MSEPTEEKNYIFFPDMTAVAMFKLGTNQYYIFYTDGTEEYANDVFKCSNHSGQYTIIGCDVITRKLSGNEKTLTDEEINKVQEKIIKNLTHKLNAELRNW